MTDSNPKTPWIVTKYPQLAKMAVWIGLIVLIYWLSSFFLLIFLTFIFAFLQYRVSEKIKGKIKHRALRTWLVGLVFLVLISGTMYFVTTEVKKQTISFFENFEKYIEAVDAQVNKLAESSPLLNQMLIDMHHFAHPEANAVKSPTLLILQSVFDLPTAESSGNIKKNIGTVFLYSGKMMGIASSFLLSLLFSFLIILDYPRLTHAISRFEKSRFGFVFQEVKPGIVQFARTVGRAFEAQFFIALLNSMLTFVVLLILGIGKYSAFLISIVFFCSFIPIAGVFISSVPICMMSLQQDGVGLMFAAISLITFIHMIEAYILNPRIYGSHLRLNPVVVLGILTIFGKLFGLWGFILGVPLCTWFFKEVCLQEKS
ncbi:MAG: AI-2E family transporter [Fibromonadaceae bacterium]|jgi:predicted PurR-regulated permease PerM|nr:AI-2E family transporter [Fibromonadaceae bacterium]